MTITRADILHYWDSLSGILSPVVGGQPTFSRAGNAYSIQARENVLELKVDTPRFEPKGLLLEPAMTNLMTNPEDFTAWDKNFSGTALTPVVTADAAIAPDGSLTADKVTLDINGGTTSGDICQILEGFTATNGAPYASSFYIKAFQQSEVGKVVNFRGVAGASYTSITLTEKWQRVSSVETAGTASTKYIEIALRGGFGTADDATFYLWGASTESNYLTSYATGTRVAETFKWTDPPIPQAMVIYSSLIMLNPAGSAGSTNARVWDISKITDPAALVYWSSSTELRAFISNSTNSTNASVVLNPSVGDLIESVLVINADWSARLIARKNAGSVIAVSLAATSGGAPNAWLSETNLSFNSNNSGSFVGAANHKNFKIVTSTSVNSATNGTGTGDEDIMAEMAALYVSNNGERVSNAF